MFTLPEWAAGVHHDGSSVYVSNIAPRLGESIHIRLRAPKDAPIKQIFLRSDPDGEPHLEKMVRVEEDSLSAYWVCHLRITMPFNHYRFKLLSDDGAYYLTTLGMSRADKPNWFDFKIAADYAAPAWVREAVFYQIFPDRFHNGDPNLTIHPDEWEAEGFEVYLKNWGDQPQPWSETRNRDFYGGDLVGIIQQLDYLQTLGVNALYLNPIFTSRSNHRYDIMDFDEVDRHLGGNETFIQLREALDEREMYVMLDVTPNHLSWRHPWFQAAQADPNAPTFDYFTFYDDQRQTYESWLGVSSLVKLNYTSQKLRDAMYRNPDSVLRRWVAEPYRIDGWRLDVMNMVGRQGKDQLQREVGRELRTSLKTDNPQVYIMGEHFFDGTPHLQGDELDATMNYQGFLMPIRRWLTGYDAGSDWAARGRVDVDWSLLPTEALSEQLQTYLGAIPWVVALQQFNQLDSHDTIRFLSAAQGNKALLKMGAALLMTYVGTPCIYYGDEVGLEGGADPDNRRCMPWGAFDEDMLAYFRTLIRLRRTSPALQEGGFQILYAQEDIFAFQRQSATQRLLIMAYRGRTHLVETALSVRAAGLADGVRLVNRLTSQSHTVQNGKIVVTDMPPQTVWIWEVEQ